MRRGIGRGVVDPDQRRIQIRCAVELEVPMRRSRRDSDRDRCKRGAYEEREAGARVHESSPFGRLGLYAGCSQAPPGSAARARQVAVARSHSRVVVVSSSPAVSVSGGESPRAMMWSVSPLNCGSMMSFANVLGSFFNSSLSEIAPVPTSKTAIPALVGAATRSPNHEPPYAAHRIPCCNDPSSSVAAIVPSATFTTDTDPGTFSLLARNAWVPSGLTA